MKYGCVAGVDPQEVMNLADRQRISHAFHLPLDRLAAAVDMMECL